MTDKTQTKKQELKMLSRPPAMAVDGNSLSIRDLSYGDLTFFQVYNKIDNVIEAHGIANLRLTIDQLKALRDMLGQVIADHEVKIQKKD